jgi:hypothetical protein
MMEIPGRMPKTPGAKRGRDLATASATVETMRWSRQSKTCIWGWQERFA